MPDLTELQRLAEGAERVAFELWYVGHTFDKSPPEIERDAQGNYKLMQARQAWNAYHAGWHDYEAISTALEELK